MPRACGHRCAMLFAVRVDIDVYDPSGNIVHIAATSSMSTSESNKPCIVVEERGTADSYTRTTASTPSRISVPVSPSQRVCFLSPTEVSFYKKIELGKILSRHLASHESWNLLFLHSDAAFVRFNFSVPHSARMALLARRNEPPSITAYDIMEVIADHHRLYRRTTAMVMLEFSTGALTTIVRVRTVQRTLPDVGIKSLQSTRPSHLDELWTLRPELHLESVPLKT
ncbi:hypothetical protein AVEN_220021-1 [Araneus ventricosus]|uniref:Teneurin-1-4-like galactose-binding domain-containing protein n=1 Tax=Araneus ventricosus TaxID=182803 RepID=A0A4Y2CRN3_ARAVE|nr:hypothetical protein AVEN_220021-1 [Araneus ventricosus]